MVEPFAIGLQAAARARIVPGDVAAAIGSDPIGIMTAMAALAGGCGSVSDFSSEKLAIAGHYQGICPGKASGGQNAFDAIFDMVRPGGAVVLVGLPVLPVPFSSHAAILQRSADRARYANVFDHALSLTSNGKVDLKALISDTYGFADAVQAFERAASARPSDVKIQIRVSETSFRNTLNKPPFSKQLASRCGLILSYFKYLGNLANAHHSPN